MEVIDGFQSWSDVPSLVDSTPKKTPEITKSKNGNVPARKGSGVSMSINRWDAKRDESEPAIVEALRSVGADVALLKQPVDLLIGFRGKTYLAEVKTGKAKLTTGKNGQKEFVDEWRGAPVPVFRTPMDAISWINGLEAT